MQDIVIWGTGVIARQVFYRAVKAGYHVKYFLDNMPVDSFYGIRVYRPTQENCSECFIVVASNTYYEEVSLQLLQYGLEELKNFIPYQAMGKKVVLVHGNCHTNWIIQYLKTSSTFMERFYIYLLPVIHHNKRGYINEQLLRNCDVFITQDVQENNRYDKRLSFNYLKSRVSGKVICIPNVYGLGKILFPQAELSEGDDDWHNPKGREMENGLFIYRDVNIDRIWSNGERNIDNIVKYLDTEIYSRQEIEDNLESCLKKWEEREQVCDVKIMDYIKQEYKKQLLFYEPAIPCCNILRKISEDILEILDIDKNEIHEIEGRIATLGLPIYRCVKDALGLEFDNKYIRSVPLWELSKLIPDRMDLTEYCREYCYWCHDWYPDSI